MRQTDLLSERRRITLAVSFARRWIISRLLFSRLSHSLSSSLRRLLCWFLWLLNLYTRLLRPAFGFGFRLLSAALGRLHVRLSDVLFLRGCRGLSRFGSSRGLNWSLSLLFRGSRHHLGRLIRAALTRVGARLSISTSSAGQPRAWWRQD